MKFKKEAPTFKDVMKLYVNRKYKPALKMTEQLLVTEKESFELKNIAGDMYMKTGNLSMAQSIFKDLKDSFEKGRYYDKAIALTKKLLRAEPGDVQNLEALALYYGKKGLKKDQTNILRKLADKYASMQEFDYYVRYMNKCLEADPHNVELHYDFSDRLEHLAMLPDVAEVAKHALANCKLKPHELAHFFDLAVKNKVAPVELIEFFPVYLEERPEKLDFILENAEPYLMKKDDIEFMSELIEAAGDNDLTPLMNKLKKHNHNYLAYKYLINKSIEEKRFDDFKSILIDIKNMPESVFNGRYVNAAIEDYEKIDDPELLELMGILCERAKAENERVKVLSKLRMVYEGKGEKDKVAVLDNVLFGVPLPGSKTTKNIEQTEMLSLDDSTGPADDPLAMMDMVDSNEDSLDFEPAAKPIEFDTISYSEQTEEVSDNVQRIEGLETFGSDEPLSVDEDNAPEIDDVFSDFGIDGKEDDVLSSLEVSDDDKDEFLKSFSDEDLNESSSFNKEVEIAVDDIDEDELLMDLEEFGQPDNSGLEGLGTLMDPGTEVDEFGIEIAPKEEPEKIIKTSENEEHKYERKSQRGAAGEEVSLGSMSFDVSVDKNKKKDEKKGSEALPSIDDLEF